MPPFTTCISWPTLRSDAQNQKKTQKARKASKKVGDWGWGSCTHRNRINVWYMYRLGNKHIPPGEKENIIFKMSLKGDMLVLRRVSTCILDLYGKSIGKYEQII